MAKHGARWLRKRPKPPVRLHLNNGQKTFVTESFESGVDDYCWNNDSQSLYFIGVWHGTSMVYSTNLNGDIKKLTDGMYDYGSVAMAGDKIITKQSFYQCC